MNLNHLLRERRDHMERGVIERALRACVTVKVAAEHLGVSRSYLHTRMSELDIEVPPCTMRPVDLHSMLREQRDHLELGVIVIALREGRTVRAAARQLGINSSHLHRRMARLGIETPLHAKKSVHRSASVMGAVQRWLCGRTSEEHRQ